MANVARGSLIARVNRFPVTRYSFVVNLLQTTLAPAAVQAPFNPTDWPLPARNARRTHDTGSSGILIDLLPMLRQDDWPNPPLRRVSRQVHAAENLLTTTLAPPFVQSPLHVRPFVQPWLIRTLQPGNPPNLLSNTLSVRPFIPSVWPNPARLPRTQWDTWHNLRPLYIDVTPDAFSFIDVTGVARSTTITSLAITVSGINALVPISVTGGTYSANGGPFTASAGFVSNGDTVRAQHTSRADYLATTNTTVTIGGLSGTFTSTTLESPEAGTPIVNAHTFTYTAQDTICDRTGFKVPRNTLRKEWNGLMVRPESWEMRHPQDLVRARPEHPKGSPRPEPPDTFIEDDDPIDPSDL